MSKPRAKELKDIKDAIKDFKNNRSYAKREEKQIAKRYAEQLSQYNPENWVDHSVINALTEQLKSAINGLYDSYGNDTTIHIIYTDGSQCVASGTEIVTGEITPKLQYIAYASYMDGWTEFDTLTGPLDDKWNLDEEEGFDKREEYFNDIEIKFGTDWGKKHANQ